MRLFVCVLASVMPLAAVGPGLAQVHSVYVLSMGGGMDQFLANRLAHTANIQVVSDPQLADTVLTDKIGEPFEKKLDELYMQKDEDEKADDRTGVEKNQLRPSSFGRGKGTFFLVDRKTRAVVWSTYVRPKNSSTDEMNKAAGRVVENLKHDLKPDVKQ